MTTGQDWIVDYRQSRAPTGWFVIHRARCDEAVTAPAQIIRHESGRQRLAQPAGDNSQVFAPTTGFPAINVPMGYSRGGTLPVGMTFYARAWSEAELIKLAYAYEQATKHRRPPVSTPPLR